MADHAHRAPPADATADAAHAARIDARLQVVRRPGAAAARAGRHQPRRRARASSSACWGRPAAASPPCSTWSPGSTGRPPGTIEHARRAARPDVPGARAVPVADRRQATSNWRCGCAACRAPSAGSEAERLLALVRLRRRVRQAGARAVRRHAAARRAGPGARPGQPAAADGRAVRRARRHHPRRAARGADPDLGGDRRVGPVRHPQRARGGPARPAGRAAVLPAGPDRRASGRWTSRSRAGSRTRRSPTCPSRSPTDCVRRSAAMAGTETARGEDTAADRPEHPDLAGLGAGLDALETRPAAAVPLAPDPAAPGSCRRSPRSPWC